MKDICKWILTFIIFQCFLKLLVSSRLDIMEKDISYSTKELISGYIVDICERYFSKYRFIILVNTNSYVSHFEETTLITIYNQLYIPILLPVLTKEEYNITTNYDGTGKAYAFLLFVNSVETFQWSFKELEKKNFWNSRGKFLVVVSKDILSYKSFDDIFHIGWKRNQVLFMHIISSTNTCDTVSNVHSKESCSLITDYNPFQNKTNYYLIPKEAFVNNITLFEDKTKNLFSYPVRASWYDVPPFFTLQHDENNIHTFEGNFGKMFETQSQLMNFSIDFQLFRDTETAGVYMKHNNTWDGAIGDLLSGHADVGPSAVTLTYFRNLFVEFSEIIMIDHIVFAVPKSEQVPDWQTLKEPFSHTLWILIVVSFAFISGIVVARSYLNRNLNTNLFDHFNVLIVLLIFLSQSLPRMPKSDIMRIILIVWILMLAVVNSLYQGSLISYITSPHHLPEIDTVDDIALSDLEILTYSSYIDFIKTSSNSALRSLTSRTEITSKYQVALDRVSHSRDVALLADLELLDFSKATMYVDGYGEPLFHTASEIVHVELIGYIVPRGSPYIPRWNSIIRQALEAGLPSKWRKDYYLKTVSIFEPSKNSLVVLSLSILQTAFYILGAGMILGIVTFYSEFMFVKMFYKREMRK